jgi:bla regulator protein blaR1
MMLPTLLSASIDGAVFVAAVWLLTRTLSTLSPATRTLLWWAAAAKFVIALVWVSPLVVRILPGEAATLNTSTISVPVSPPRETAAPSLSTGRRTEDGKPSRWKSAILGVWMLGVGLAAAVGVTRWRQARGVKQRSEPAPAALQALTAELAGRLGLRRIPDVRLSDEVATPMVAGILRPTVLLPIDRFSALSGDQQQMAVCHELAHLKRADLWLGCVPALAERLFFFHPLAHIAAREYALWREAACDAAVLQALDAAPRAYGQLLLNLGVTPRPAGLVAAGTSWSFSSLKRRIAMLQRSSNPSIRSRLAALALIVIAIAALIPVQLAARQTPPPQPPEAALLAPLVAGETPPLVNSAISALTGGLAPHAGELVNEALASLTSGLAPQRDEPRRQRQGDDRDLNFVFFITENHTTMSGSMNDINRARQFKRAGEQLLWFRQGGREYVIRDRGMLRQIEDLWAPVGAIGDQQGVLGHDQGEIGKLQGELGAKQGLIGLEQGKIGGRQGILGERQGRLADEESRRSLSATGREKVELERRTLDQEMRALDEQMRVLDDKMRELDRPMRELDDKMAQLDREMQELDRKMKIAQERAEKAMREILDRAIASGIAEVVR